MGQNPGKSQPEMETSQFGGVWGLEGTQKEKGVGSCMERGGGLGLGKGRGEGSVKGMRWLMGNSMYVASPAPSRLGGLPARWGHASRLSRRAPPRQPCLPLASPRSTPRARAF